MVKCIGVAVGEVGSGMGVSFRRQIAPRARFGLFEPLTLGPHTKPRPTPRPLAPTPEPAPPAPGALTTETEDPGPGAALLPPEPSPPSRALLANP